MAKERLDVLVVNRGLAGSRERARSLIMEGRIFVDGVREDKPGTKFDPERIREIVRHGEDMPYVSRGGYKLEKALEVFGLDPQGAVCMDVGASTGGFTDVLLQHGAVRVYAVDSGTNQLAWSLRSDERVVCMERTNFRYMTAADVPELMDMVTADVSFISLRKILPPARALMKSGGYMVCLIKPQFEAGRDAVGKHGIVRDKAVHTEVIEKVCMAATDEGFVIRGLDYSPIKGTEGNIEYLLALGTEGEDIPTDISAVVERAHGEL